MQITRNIAQKVVETVSAGLCSGVGEPVPGQMCVEAAVCYAMGLPHGDEPVCVSKTLRTLKISLNDAAWSSNAARANGLLKLAVLQLGTNENFDDKEFLNRLVKVTIGKIVPKALRHAASIHSDLEHKKALEKAAIECEEKQNGAANYAASDAARAASYAARAASFAASDAARAASFAASDAARAASNAARAASYAASDKELKSFAEEVENILIEMNVPGVKWLSLIKDKQNVF
jgi:hypothetical protein